MYSVGAIANMSKPVINVSVRSYCKCGVLQCKQKF